MSYLFRGGIDGICKGKRYIRSEYGYRLSKHMYFSRTHGFVFAFDHEDYHREYDPLFDEEVVSFEDAIRMLGCKSEARLKKILLKGSKFKSGETSVKHVEWCPYMSRETLLAIGVGVILKYDFDRLVKYLEKKLFDAAVESELRVWRTRINNKDMRGHGTTKTAATQLRALGILA